MTPATTPPAPGSMTVPPLSGWEDIVILLALLMAVAVAFLVLAATRRGARGRSEWQAWLDARSSGRHDLATDPDAAELVRPESSG